MNATLYTDGGARGNPGPAGIGFMLTINGHEPILHGEYIGETTNNQAEYKALLAGLTRAHQEGVTDIECFLDSELVVKQLRGEYRIKHADLKPRAAEVKEAAALFSSVRYSIVRREKNVEADEMVNKAIDEHVGQ